MISYYTMHNCHGAVILSRHTVLQPTKVVLWLRFVKECRKNALRDELQLYVSHTQNLLHHNGSLVQPVARVQSASVWCHPTDELS